MTTDAAARDYLDYYLDKPGNPDFAVMLEGPWGSGKSFFLDQYFADRHAKALRTDKKAKEAIRVTLFGVRELDDIMSQIFAKAHPVLGGKAVRAVNLLGSRAASFFGGSLDPTENAKLLQDMVLDLQDRVLVFDDFERCPLPPVEVMGFLNRFVEQDKVKVVVVADEENINTDEAKEYRRRKEKLIGKTIRVGSDPATVLDAFAAALSGKEARDTIAMHREQALATFLAAGRPNFRSLRAILSDFDRIASLADPKLKASEPAMKALLLYMLAVGVEFRSDGIDVEGLRTLTSDIVLRGRLSKTEESTGRQRGSLFRSRYPLVSWGDPVVPPELLAELFASGTVDLVSVDAHLNQHPLVVGREQVPAWRAMWSWYDMGETEYRKVRDLYAKQLADRELIHPGQLLHAVGSSLRLLGYGDDLLGGVAPKDFFTAYLDDVEKADTLIAATNLFGFGSDGYAGLIYNESDSAAFQEIRGLVAAAVGRALDRQTKREAPVLVDRLKADPEGGAMLYEWGPEEGNYGGIAILHHVAIGEIADLLLQDGKLNDRLLAALKERYERAQSAKSLDSEKPWVLNLHAELAGRVTSLPAPYKRFGELRLAHWFEPIKGWATPSAPPSPAAAAAKSTKRPSVKKAPTASAKAVPAAKAVVKKPRIRKKP
ncbi:P-loop NTPase fold protein [Sphingomonas kyeonggiensis]|uniref:KAP NTPase domain-containing protein n=1 Tax=Sphingomonas kyeonggiensis TaxID=1268553 RepID=A0A7W6JS27_9SPHN|nr:P-loop NTPase fold protein [Sphingomonas kyeonggiensis]MBB4097456.1 hypothetical protein [Sphingomonas kyeonggiensis]